MSFTPILGRFSTLSPKIFLCPSLDVTVWMGRLEGESQRAADNGFYFTWGSVTTAVVLASATLGPSLV